MFSKILKLFVLFLFFTAFSNSAKAVTFQNYSELYECIETHNTFFGYKKNLVKCFEKKGITIEKDSLKLIKNEYGIIDNIIDLNLPKEDIIKVKKSKKKLSEVLKKIFDPDFKEIEKKENIFNKPSALSDEYKEKSFSLNEKDFKNLNNHIKRNPEDIFAITEDINILTYKNQYLTEFKREEILLNVYNSFDVAILASKVPPPAEAAAFGGAGGMVAVAAIAAAAGGGGSGGGTYIPPTISFSISSTSVGECDSDVTVTANLTKAHNANVTVTYAVGGTATQDTDYTLSSTTSTIVSGATSGTITLNPTNDTTAETSETVTLSASVSEVSTTGDTSTTITIHDYVLKCNTTAFSEGTTSEQNTIKNRSTWTAIEAGGAVHPYEQMGIHKVQSFSSSGVNLTGVGETIHVADFNCDDSHDIYNNKTITNLDNGDAGESTFSNATAADNHCQGVAMFAAGDVGARSGVAPDADLVLSSIPDIQGSNEGDDYAADLDAARAAGAIASNQSWGYTVSGTSYNITELQADISSNGWTAAEGLANLMHGGTSGQALTDANTYVTALNNFEDSGVVVWAAANSTSESDANALGGLPEIFSQLGESWIVANVVEYTGDADLSNAVASEFTLRGNPCGSTAAYCLSVDGWDTFQATWVDSGTSKYSTGRISFGSSWSAPMVSGGIALMAQAFPNHTPEQLVDRVLASANNVWFTPTGNTTFTTHGASIKHGYHSTWGHGVPDFYAAMSPITSSSNPASGFGFASPQGSGGNGGSGSVPFSQIKKLAVYETAMKASSSFGDGILNGLKDKTAYAYDALNGGFKYNVNDFINYDSLTEQKIEHTLDQEVNFLRNFNVNKDITKDAQDFNIYAGEYVNLRDKHNRGLSITLNQPNIALQNFNLYNNQSYKNPFTSENKGVGFNNKFYFFGNNVMLGYNNSEFNPLSSVNENLVTPMETLALSVNIDNDNFNLLSFTSGLIKEKNTFLLSEGSGAFDLSDEDNISNFYGFNLSKSLSDFSNIYLSTMFGNSKLNNANNSFIVDASDVLSSSFEINYELKNPINSDQLNISLSQPNRVEQGEMTFRFMGLADKNGVLPYQDEKISLSPSGRQKDLTVSYYKNHSKNLKTGIKAVLTDDLGHVKNNNLDTNLLLSATYSF